MDSDNAAYRKLFSHPEMVRDLLLGFTPPDWVRHLHLDTLEKVDDSDVPADLPCRDNDVIWRVSRGPDHAPVYLLLEFHSTEDRLMGVHVFL